MPIKLGGILLSVLLLSLCSQPQASHQPTPKTDIVIQAPSPSPSPAAAAAAPPPPPPPSPTPLPQSVLIKVPYTSQAPYANWATHEDYCEAAAILMYRDYLRGDRRSDIPAAEADADMTGIIKYERSYFKQAHPDLTLQQMGTVAANLYGFHAQVGPVSVDAIKHSIAGGHPVIIPVMTHGAPGGQKLSPAYGYENVYHVLLLVGYDANHLFANDAGFMGGGDYAYTWYTLSSAIDAQNPKMGQGRVMLTLGR